MTFCGTRSSNLNTEESFVTLNSKDKTEWISAIIFVLRTV